MINFLSTYFYFLSTYGISRYEKQQNLVNKLKGKSHSNSKISIHLKIINLFGMNIDCIFQISKHTVTQK